MSNIESLTIPSLVKTKLPPLPGSVLKILRMLQDVNVSQTALANAIGIDPMLASRVLRLANSPIYSPLKPVTNVSAAASAIGNRSIYDIVIINAAGDTFGQEIRGSVVGREIWFHSLATGMAAGDLCVLARMRGGDEAFICGLLHDIGKLLLLKADSVRYTELIEQSKEEDNLSELEKGIFGFDHAALGAAAARAWHFPEPICEVILGHHEPDTASGAEVLTRIVNIADTLVYRKNAGLDVYELIASDEVAQFGFTVEQFENLWESVIQRLREVIRSFLRGGLRGALNKLADQKSNAS